MISTLIGFIIGFFCCLILISFILRKPMLSIEVETGKTYKNLKYLKIKNLNKVYPVKIKDVKIIPHWGSAQLAVRLEEIKCFIEPGSYIVVPFYYHEHETIKTPDTIEVYMLENYNTGIEKLLTYSISINKDGSTNES